MPETESIAAPISCEGCGLEMKSEALFCTGCGTRVPSAPSSSAALTCTECDQPLRENAEFCTECGTAAATGGAIDLKADAHSDKEAKPATPGTKPASQVAAADRVSPAASRAILGSVGGGMGSYVGSSRTAGGTEPPPPSTAVRTAAAAASRKKTLAIIGVVAALLTLTAVVGILVATQQDQGSELRAGQGTGSGSDEMVVTTNAKGDKVTTTDAPKSDKDSKKDTKKDSKDTTKSDDKGDSKSKDPKDSKKSDSTTPGTIDKTPDNKGTVRRTTPPPSGGNPTPTPTPPPIVKPPPGPAKLSMSGADVLLAGSAPRRTVYVSNTGGKSMSWHASLSGIPGATLSPSSGSVPAGKWVAITVTWSPWAPGGSVRTSSDEGSWTGTLSVDAGGAGSHHATVRADNRKGDVITSVYMEHCVNPSGTLCRPGSTLRVNVSRSAQGAFTGSFPTMVRFAVNNFGLSGWQTISPWKQNTYPTAQFVVTVPNSVRTGSSKLRMVVKDETGAEGAESSAIIWP